MGSRTRKPKISVIMPVYNAEQFLNESVLSVLNQTFKDFEFIIINDCSTDGSLKMIKEYMEKDKRIVLINNRKNIGVASSRSKGLKIAKGEYVVVFDADDICLKNRLELQYAFMERNKEIYLCGTSAIVIDEEGEKIGILKKFNDVEKIKDKLLKGNPIIHPSVIHRNIDRFLYREKFTDADEYDVYLRMLSKGKKITNMPDFLIKYRLYQGSTSLQKKFDNQFFTDKIKEFYLQRELHGKDEYETFDITKFLDQRVYRDSYVDLLQARITAGFQAGYGRQVRKDIKDLMKKKGLDKSLLVIYILSFAPNKLIWFVKELGVKSK